MSYTPSHTLTPQEPDIEQSICDEAFSPSMYFVPSPKLGPDDAFSLSAPPSSSSLGFETQFEDLTSDFFPPSVPEVPTIPLDDTAFPIFPPLDPQLNGDHIPQQHVMSPQNQSYTTSPHHLTNASPLSHTQHDESFSSNDDSSEHTAKRARQVPNIKGPLSLASSTSPDRKKKRSCPTTSLPDEDLDDDQLAKRMRRRQRNKESAQQSRQRKKQFMDELSHQVTALSEENANLQSQMRDLMAQNELLKRTLQSNGISVPQITHRPSSLFNNVINRGGAALFSVALIVMIVSNPLGLRPDNVNFSYSGRALQSIDDDTFITSHPQPEPIFTSSQSHITSDPKPQSYPVSIIEEDIDDNAPPRPPAPASSSTTTSSQRTSSSSSQHTSSSSTSHMSTPQLTTVKPIVITNSTGDNDAALQDVVMNALQHFSTSTRFEHRFASLYSWEALQFIKESGRPNTQYIFCSEAHSIYIDDPKPLPAPPASSSPSASIVQHRLRPQNDDMAPISILLPGGIIRDVIPEHVRESVKNGRLMDEMMCPVKMNVTHHSMESEIQTAKEKLVAADSL